MAKRISDMAATGLEDNATEFVSGFHQAEVTEVIDFMA
jgi:hypothetical protein